MNYQHIARLAELVIELSDMKNIGHRLDVDLLVTCIATSPNIEVSIHSWADDLSVIRLQTNPITGECSYTTSELIAILEQIKACGFRDEQEVAA